MKYCIRDYGHRLINPISRLTYAAQSTEFAFNFWVLNINNYRNEIYMVLPTYFRTEITLELQKILKYPYFVIKKKKSL